jgi:hypothetical protein
MFGGLPINFYFGFTSGGTNLVCATNGSDIFVDYSRSDEFLNGYYFATENFKFLPLECNINLFDHFFNPYIFLNLEEFFSIPTSPYFSLDPIVHPSTTVVLFSTSSFVLCLTSFVSASSGCDYLISFVVIVMSSTTDSIMCLIFVSASCAYDFVLSLVANLFVSSSNYQLTSISITCDLMVFGFKYGEGTISYLGCFVEPLLRS